MEYSCGSSKKIMTKFFTSVVLSIAFLSTLLGQEETPWIQYKGAEVNPKRILVRFSNPSLAQDKFLPKDLLQRVGVKVAYRMQTVAGLVILENIGGNQQPRAGYHPDKGNLAKQLEEQINLLQESGLFTYVEPDFIWQPSLEATDPSYVDGTLWGLRNDGNPGVEDADIDADEAWDTTVGSRDVVIGVIDTGIRYTHQDLASQMWVNEGEIPGNGIDDDQNGWVDDVHGINAIFDSGDPLDVDDHGTHCASVIGASMDDSDVVGVNWEVQIMALKFLGPFGGANSDAVKCVDYSVQMGAHILNNSWGGGSYSQALFDSVANAQSNDVLFVVASGNSGLNNDIFPDYPSTFDLDNVVSVGAMDRFDRLADFSNYGKNSVDLVAPGVDIYMAGSGDPADQTGSNPVEPDADYDTASGTSFAAPYVAGVAGLIKAAFPESTATEIKTRLLESVVKLSPYADKVATGGRLNAKQALEVEPDGVLELSVDPPSQSVLLEGSDQIITVRVSDLVGVNNATVQVVLPDGQVADFLNDGVAPDIKPDDSLYTYSFPVPAMVSEVTLNISATAPDKIGVSTQVVYGVVPPPTNDDFEDAIKVSSVGGRFITNNQFATLQEEEPAHAGLSTAKQSLWWSWSPRDSGQVLIDTAGSGFDSVLAIYEGNSLDQLVPVASIDNVGTKKEAHLSLDVEAGNSYRIAVSSTASARGGTLRLRIQPNGVLDTTLPVAKFIAPANGFLSNERQIVVKGYSFDPEPNASGINQVFIKVNGENVGGAATGTLDWEAPAFLTHGVNRIQVQVSDFAGNRSIVDELTVSYLLTDPANDHINNATEITELSGQIEGDTTEATKQFGEPFHAGNKGGASLWYSFTPAENGLLTMSTIRTQFDSLLAIYTGLKPSDLVRVASNDDANPDTSNSKIEQALEAGVRYLIAVDGFGNERGAFTIRYEFVANDLKNVSVQSTDGGIIEGPSGNIVADTEIVLTAIPDFGFEFKGWEGSINSLDNPLTVVVDANLELQANFGPITVGDNFESGTLQLPFTFAGVPWELTDEASLSGNHSIRSGRIEDGGESVLSLRHAFSEGRGKFDLKVSTEGGWDALTFFIDGKQVSSWSGERDWQRFEFIVSEGEHLLEWVYVKDFSNSEGLDAVFMDNLDLPLVTSQDEQNPASVVVVPSDNGQLDIQVQGAPNTNYVVETSKGLQQWEAAFTGKTDSEGKMVIRNATGSGRAQSFFRAVAE
jgi:subtilisin family serine protease